MVPRYTVRQPLRAASVATLSVAAIFLLTAPGLAAAVTPPAAPVPTAAAGCAGIPVLNGISANVLWNGANVCSYSSASSALSIDFSKTADLRFFWNATSGAAVQVNDTRLEMFYFGFALVTRDQIASAPESGGGTFDMSWTPGALSYVLEGVYGVRASLVAPNGSSVWSERFFVTAAAPFSILAALPILLVVIAIYEAYALATAGRQESLRGRPTPPPGPGEVSAPPSPSAEETPPEETPAPAAEGEKAP